MSDLQIFTGLSILISSFANLKCGLSCYHWQVMVYLAWFSALTHLSCLTVLRSLLYNNKGERTWRIFGMGAVLGMLITAMIPTGNYDWLFLLEPQEGQEELPEPMPAPRDYARCYFDFSRREGVVSINFATMFVSVLLLAFGFVIRIIKAYRVLSIDIAKIRDHVSRWIRTKVLLWVYTKLRLGENEKAASIGRLLIYRPLFAAFITCQLLADVWASMLLEVWWLITAFAWGSINLFKTRALSDGGNSDWSFGQIIPVVLLAAPLTMIIEYLSEDHPEVRLTGATVLPPNTPPNDSSEPVALTTMTLQSDEGDTIIPIDHPDWDCYKHGKWINELFAFVVASIIYGISIIIALFRTLNGRILELLIPTSNILVWLPMASFIALHLQVLIYLLVPDLEPSATSVGPGPKTHSPFHIEGLYYRLCRFVRWITPWISLWVVPLGPVWSGVAVIILVSVGVGVYMLLSVLACVVEKQQRRLRASV